MADKTTYSIEVWDPSWEYELGGDGWTYHNGSAGRSYDTFSDVQDDAIKAAGIYRKVRVVQHTRRLLAEYEDGHVSG